MRLRRRAVLAVTLAAAFGAGLAAGAVQDSTSLTDLGPAAAFTLTDETGRQVSRTDFDGKAQVVSFIFTRCADVCPVLSSKLADLADVLAAEGRDFHFLTITVDPLNDTPEVLRDYALRLEYDPAHWSFLTGDLQTVSEVARAYGVFMAAHPHGTVQHSLVTTLIDREGTKRVQYLGEKFDTDELLADLRSLTE